MGGEVCASAAFGSKWQTGGVLPDSDGKNCRSPDKKYLKVGVYHKKTYRLDLSGCGEIRANRRMGSGAAWNDG